MFRLGQEDEVLRSYDAWSNATWPLKTVERAATAWKPSGVLATEKTTSEASFKF